VDNERKENYGNNGRNIPEITFWLWPWATPSHHWSFFVDSNVWERISNIIINIIFNTLGSWVHSSQGLKTKKLKTKLAWLLVRNVFDQKVSCNGTQLKPCTDIGEDAAWHKLTVGKASKTGCINPKTRIRHNYALNDRPNRCNLRVFKVKKIVQRCMTEIFIITNNFRCQYCRRSMCINHWTNQKNRDTKKEGAV